MPFKPSKSLLSAERFISNYFNPSVKDEKNESSKNVNLKALFTAETDPQNKLLICFYAQLHILHQTFLQMRSGETNHAEFLNLQNLVKNVTTLLDNIFSDEELWLRVSEITNKNQLLFHVVNLTYNAIPRRIVQPLLDSVEYYIQQNNYRGLQPALRKIFWSAFIKLISQYEDVAEFFTQINETTYYLLQNNDAQDVEYLIMSYISLPSQHDKKPYRSLLAVFQLINDLDTLNAQPLDNFDFQSILANTNKGKYQFDFLKSYSSTEMSGKILEAFKDKFMFAINVPRLGIYIQKNFSANESSLAKFQKSIKLLTELFEMDEVESKRILSSIQYQHTDIKPVEEKKTHSIEVQKPLLFAPCKTLLDLANIFSNALKSIEVNIETGITTPVDLPEYKRDQSEQHDEANEKLISLFETLYNILKKSEDAKRTKEGNSFESGAEIASNILKANAILSEIFNNHPELWQFVLSWQEGREGMYFLSTIDLDFLETMSDHTDWRDAFCKDKTHPDETAVLEFFGMLLNKHKDTKKAAETMAGMKKDNVFCNAYAVFGQFDKPDMKIKKLFELAKTKFIKISDKIPRRIIRRISDVYATLLILDITSFDSNHYKEILLAINQLIQNGYLPECLEVPESASTEMQVFLTSYQYYKYLKIVKSNYTLSKQFNKNEIGREEKLVLFMSISSYGILNHFNTFTLDDNILNNLVSGISYLLRTNYLNTMRPEMLIYFWPAVVTLVKKKYPDAIHEKFNEYIDYLRRNNHQHGHIKLLQDYLIYEAGKCHESMVDINDHVLACFKVIETTFDCKNENEPCFPEYKPTVLVPDEFKPAVNFYLQTIGLIKLSHAVIRSKKTIQELIQTTAAIYTELACLQEEHVPLWKKTILPSPAGRYILYFLLIDRLFQKDIDIQITRSLISSLRKNAFDKTEIEVLDYFEFLLHKLSKIPFQITNEMKLNRLIKIHLLFNTDMKVNVDVTISALKKIISQPLIFTKAIPDFVPLLIRILNGQLCLNEINPADPNTSKYAAIVPECCDAQYFPDTLADPDNVNTSGSMRQIYTLTNDLHIFIAQFTLQKEYDKSALYALHITMQYHMISLFKHISECSWIDNKIINQYINSACTMIYRDSLLQLSPAQMKEFYKSIVKLISFMKEFNQFISGIHAIIATLFTKGRRVEAEWILYYFIDHLRILRNKPDFKKDRHVLDIHKYLALLTAIQLHRDIATVLTAQADVKQIVGICNETRELNELTFAFLNANVPSLLIAFKKQLIEDLHNITDKIIFLKSTSNGMESLKLFQTTILQFSKILGVSESELNDIKKQLHYTDDDTFEKMLQDSLFDSEPSNKANKKNKKTRKKEPEINPPHPAPADSKPEVELPPADTSDASSDSEELDLRTIAKPTKKARLQKTKPPVESKYQPKTTLQKQPPQNQPSVTHRSTTTTITSTLSSVIHSKSSFTSSRENKSAAKGPKRPLLNKSNPGQELVALSPNRVNSTKDHSNNRSFASLRMTTDRAPAPLTLADKIQFVPMKPPRVPAAPKVNTDVTATTPPNVVPTITTETTTQITLPTQESGPVMTQPEQTLIVSPEPVVPEITTETSTDPVRNLLTPSDTIVGPGDDALFDETFETKSERKGDDRFTLPQTSSSTVPATDVDDDFVVTRDQFPKEVLDFTTDLHNFTYPATKKHLYLTGGAITYLYDKEPNDGGDWDIVAFCSAETMISLLQSRGYQYEVRGLHKVIHVTLPLQECDLISVKSAPTLANLDELPMTATAAYVRAPDGLYYINKLKNICDKIPLTQEGLARFDKKLKPNAHPLRLMDDHFDRIKLLIDPHRVHRRSTIVEISCINPASYNSSISELTLIAEILNVRDLTPAAATIKLVPNAKKFSIQGSEEVLRSFQEHIIRPVNTETIFFDDLIQIFRLAKIKLKHKKYKSDTMLKDLIKISDGDYIVTLFNNFIFNSIDPSKNLTHLRQIGSKIDELFTRFDTHQAMTRLLKTHIIKGLTHMPKLDIFMETTGFLDDYLESLPRNSKKSGLYYYLYAIACATRTNEDQVKKLLAQVRMTLFTEYEKIIFDNHIRFIEGRSMTSRPSNAQPATPLSPEFMNCIIDIRMHVAGKHLPAAPAVNSATMTRMGMVR